MLVTLSSLRKVDPDLCCAIACQEASLLICCEGCFICCQVGCTEGLCCPTFLAPVQKIAIMLQNGQVEKGSLTYQAHILPHLAPT